MHVEADAADPAQVEADAPPRRSSPRCRPSTPRSPRSPTPRRRPPRPSSWRRHDGHLVGRVRHRDHPTGAQPTALSFTVDAVAQSQVSLTAAFTDLTDLTGGASTLTIRKAGRHARPRSRSAPTPPTTARAITAVGRGRLGRRGDASNGSTRLQLSGTATGAGRRVRGLRRHQGGVRGRRPATRSPLVDHAAPRRTPRSRSGRAASTPRTTVTSSSNTFSDVLAGASITVSKVEADPVTLTVARDTRRSPRSPPASSARSAWCCPRSRRAPRRPRRTDSDGRTMVTGGLFSGDSAVRGAPAAALDRGVLRRRRHLAVGGRHRRRPGRHVHVRRARSSPPRSPPTRRRCRRSSPGSPQRVADVATRASRQDRRAR